MGCMMLLTIIRKSLVKNVRVIVVVLVCVVRNVVEGESVE